MYGKPRSLGRVVGVATLLLAFAPFAAQAEKDVDEQETDHSNQDTGLPDLGKIPHPVGAPGMSDGPKSHPDLGGPGRALDPLFIGRVESPLVGRVLDSLDPNELLMPILNPPDEWPLPQAPPGVGERFVDWNLPPGASGGWPDVDGIGNPGFGPPAPIPEPGTLSLLVLGGALVATGRRWGR
jgi:hypothetical protein